MRVVCYGCFLLLLLLISFFFSILKDSSTRLSFFLVWSGTKLENHLVLSLFLFNEKINKLYLFSLLFRTRIFLVHRFSQKKRGKMLLQKKRKEKSDIWKTGDDNHKKLLFFKEMTNELKKNPTRFVSFDSDFKNFFFLKQFFNNNNKKRNIFLFC